MNSNHPCSRFVQGDGSHGDPVYNNVQRTASHLPSPLPFPYVLPARGFPGTCCPLINVIHVLHSCLRKQECCGGWGWGSWLYAGLAWSHPAKLPELHGAQRPQADGTQRWLVCPPKRIQTKCHVVKSAICSDNMFKTAKWPLSGAEGTLKAMSLLKCISSEHLMRCTNV